MTTVHFVKPKGCLGHRGVWAGAALVALGLLSACGGGVDISADGDTEFDRTDQRVVTTPVDLDPTPTPSPTPVLDPAATPTRLPVPTVAPTSTPLPTPTPSPTPTPLPAQASIRAPAIVRTEVGVTVATGIITSSPANNPITSVQINDGPPGLVDPGSFSPSEPGSWNATLIVTDSFDRETRRRVNFLSRYPARPNAVLAIGDSIASGHGLELTDYLGGDDCFRSNKGYPKLVVDRLVAQGRLPADTELGLVACSGFDSEDLTTKLVEGGIAGTEPDDGTRRTQVDWVVRANPALVFLSVGINDLGFEDPARFIAGDKLNSDLVEPRLGQLTSRLSAIVTELLGATDALVVVTGYYNPTAERPQGVPGCETTCFFAVSEEAVRRLNGAIVAALPASDRIAYVDLAQTFAGHGAPNGIGPDDARAGSGLIGDLLGGYFEDIQPYCAKGDGGPDPWVNAIDCVHPTEEGARAIADAVIGSLDGLF